MAKRLRLRRGTAAEHKTFVGAVGEVTVNTDENRLHVHDDSTAGGIPVAKKSEVDAKLSTTGGTMTGDLILRTIKGTDDASEFRIFAGPTMWGGGSVIQMYGKDSGQRGAFWIYTHDGTNGCNLKLHPDGSATWGNNNILTSAGCTIQGRLDIVRTESDTAIVQKMVSHDATTTPSSQIMRSWRTTDKNGKIMGDFRVVNTTAGGFNSQVIARKYKTDGSYVDSALTVGVDTSGNPFMSYGGFHVVRAESETATVSKHSDGSLEVRMRAQVPIGSTSAALTFPEPFVNSDFYVEITQRYFGAGLVNTCYGDQSTTGLTVNMEKTSSQVQNFDVIVKGRWK